MSNDIKVLYISYDGITDPLGQSQIIPYLKGICDHGYSFDLIGFEKQQAFDKQKNTIENDIKDHKINWVPLKYHKTPPILSTMYDIWQMRSVAKRIVQSNGTSIVHCRSYISMLVGLYLKRKFGVKLIFDMRGFWADERVDGKLWKLSNPIFKLIYNYFKKKEKAYCEKSDHIVSLTHAGKKEMVSGRLFKQHYKVDAEKITVIPCAVDLDLFDPDKVTAEQVLSLKSKIGLRPADKTLIYLGSLGTWYMIKEMLEFYQAWKVEYPAFKFLWVTKDDTSIIQNYGHELNIDQEDLLFASANRSEVPVYLKMADLGIFFIKPVFSKKASSAVKAGEMIRMGIPTIYNEGVGDQDKLFKDINNSLKVNANSTNWSSLVANQEMGHPLLSNENNRSPIQLDHLSLDRCIDAYAEIYNMLIM